MPGGPSFSAMVAELECLGYGGLVLWLDDGGYMAMPATVGEQLVPLLELRTFEPQVTPLQAVNALLTILRSRNRWGGGVLKDGETGDRVNMACGGPSPGGGE
jgi:hypothetical protein